jgi:hypothetical protein
MDSALNELLKAAPALGELRPALLGADLTLRARER